MRKSAYLITVLIMLVWSNSAVLAEDELEFELTSDFFGKYIWRGQNLSDDPVLQPGLSMSYGNLTAGIWGNMDLTNINGNSGDFSEMDYSLDYSNTLPGIEGIGYSIGVIYYDFPGTTTKDTTEVYWGFNFNLPLNPSITVYHDIDEAEGSYVSLAVSHSIERICELSPELPIGLDIGASLGWGSGLYNKYYCLVVKEWNKCMIIQIMLKQPLLRAVSLSIYYRLNGQKWLSYKRHLLKSMLAKVLQ